MEAVGRGEGAGVFGMGLGEDAGDFDEGLGGVDDDGVLVDYYYELGGGLGGQGIF
jgi:hypothetical protein